MLFFVVPHCLSLQNTNVSQMESGISGKNSSSDTGYELGDAKRAWIVSQGMNGLQDWGECGWQFLHLLQALCAQPPENWTARLVEGFPDTGERSSSVHSAARRHLKAVLIDPCHHSSSVCRPVNHGLRNHPRQSYITSEVSTGTATNLDTSMKDAVSASTFAFASPDPILSPNFLAASASLKVTVVTAE
jgi:hypothetical protein